MYNATFEGAIWIIIGLSFSEAKMSMTYNQNQDLLNRLYNSAHVRELLHMNKLLEKYPDGKTFNSVKNTVKHFLKSTTLEKEITEGLSKKIYLNKDLNTFRKKKQEKTSSEPCKGMKRNRELSGKEKRQLKLGRRNIRNVSYADALLIHKHWCSYIEGMDLSNDPEAFYLQLSKCDMNGVMLRIVQAKNPSLVGVTGVVIVDRKFTFTVVDSTSAVKVIPKVGCVFEIFWQKSDDKKIHLFGKYMCIRPEERAVRKIRTIMIPVL